MSGVRKIILRNLNDDKIEKLHKFWKSFYAWFNSDALKNGIIKKEYVYYNSNWNGGTYELNIEFGLTKKNVMNLQFILIII